MSIHSYIPPSHLAPNSPLAHGHYTTATNESHPPQHTTSGAAGAQENNAFSLGQKTPSATSPDTVADSYKTIIFGSNTASGPTSSYTKEERVQHVDDYAKRVKSQIANIENGRESERNVKFQSARQFMEPAGYFSGGLLAAGYDPHQKVKVTFNTYVGMGVGKTLTRSDVQIYYAWEIAAGALAHDKVPRGGVVNFHSMVIDKECKALINALEPLGQKLQNHWEREIAAPMRDASGELERRSGKADTYVIRGTLQSLASNKDSFEQLSPDAKEAINRTLKHNGQVIIPNVYGYPLSGYTFIPYTPYDGNYENRPNQGLMIDLKHGAVHEIKGDKAFAGWAKNNRENLKVSFNAGDRQGGKDAHWPKTGDVLDTLIRGNNATYPGYQNLLKDKAIPVQELFNYTRARDEDYQLKYGSLDNISSTYQEQNAKNSIWTDQTEVFGSSQKSWKSAKDFWGNTFGYVPIVGNAGNIVFGVHDGIYGKTADDRVGGNAGAVISGLQLAHELATSGLSAGLEEPTANFNSTATGNYSWRYNSPTNEFELVRTPKASNASDSIPAIKEGTAEITPTTEQHVAFPGMREIEFKGRKYFVADKPDTGDGQHYLLRVRHPEDPSKLASAGIIAKPDDTGVWQRRGVEGGAKWPWQRNPSPTPSDDAKTPPKISDGFEILGDPKTSGAERLDEVLNYNSKTHYQESVSNFEEGGTAKQKLTVTWSVEENNFNVSPTEAAGPNEYGTTPYSQNFLKDLNRDRFTVVTKGNAGDTRVELDATGTASGETLQKRLQQFENAIPNSAMRARTSEIAHQGSVAPASGELAMNQLKDHVGFRGADTHYTIIYDPANNTAEVRVTAQIQLLDLDKDAAVIPDMEVTAQRTLKIRESNELVDDGNPYVVEKEAPFTLSVSSISDLG